jgi:hypothetical protein
MLLFTAEIDANNEQAVNLPGFSHWSLPKAKYPGQQNSPIIRTIYFGAKHRHEASQQLRNILGITTPCNLSEGRKSTLITPNMSARIEAWRKLKL